MPVSAEYRRYVLDQLSRLPDLVVKPMFGGAGLYQGAVIFGFLLNDRLYFKVDDGNRADYEEAGATQFVPMSRGKPFPMPYWDVPAEILEDPDDLLAWARHAVSASLRVAQAPRRNKAATAAAKPPARKSPARRKPHRKSPARKKS